MGKVGEGGSGDNMRGIGSILGACRTGDKEIAGGSGDNTRGTGSGAT